MRRPLAWNSAAYTYARSGLLQSKQARSTQNEISRFGLSPCFFARSKTLHSMSLIRTKVKLKRHTFESSTLLAENLVRPWDACCEFRCRQSTSAHSLDRPWLRNAWWLVCKPSSWQNWSPIHLFWPEPGLWHPWHQPPTLSATAQAYGQVIPDQDTLCMREQGSVTECLAKFNSSCL